MTRSARADGVPLAYITVPAFGALLGLTAKQAYRHAYRDGAVAGVPVVSIDGHLRVSRYAALRALGLPYDAELPELALPECGSTSTAPVAAAPTAGGTL